LSSEVSRQGTYVVCLDCGKEFDYDWKSMRVGNQLAHVSVAAHAHSLSTANR
jgi:hypothetical protein